MRLKSLAINGFRNIRKVELAFDSEFPVFSFVGPNGHGKTNILEAIFLLAISKSFRTRENQDLIDFEWDYCALKGEVMKDDDLLELELIITRQPPKKTLKINGVQKKAADFVGSLNVVFFSPDDIGMIHLSPSIRRRYLDILLSQLDHDYLEASLKYQHALKQRNSLLKQIAEGKAKESDLEVWDDPIAEFGLSIIKKRADAIKQINKVAAKSYKEVSDNKDELTVKYSPSVDLMETKDRYLELLLAGRNRDIAIGSTQIGPHRDDLTFFCNDHDMALFASRGEWRSLILTLKFAEIDLLKEKTGYYPILLLDDVFSELDETRQKYLFNKIKHTQTFITTTHREFLEVIEGENKVFEVEEGQVG